MCEKNEIVVEEKDVCGFCGSTEVRVEWWPGQDGCCGYDIRICKICGRKEVL